MSEKLKSSSDLNFHVKTEVHASKIHSFHEKVRNIKLAASNTFRELLESSSCRLITWFTLKKKKQIYKADYTDLYYRMLKENLHKTSHKFYILKQHFVASSSKRSQNRKKHSKQEFTADNGNGFIQ